MSAPDQRAERRRRRALKRRREELSQRARRVEFGREQMERERAYRDARKLCSHIKRADYHLGDIPDGESGRDSLLCQKEFAEALGLITSYEEFESYTWRGIGLIWNARGEFHWANLAHCSCYGPWEESAWQLITRDELAECLTKDPSTGVIKNPTDCDYYNWEAVLGKVIELGLLEEKQ